LIVAAKALYVETNENPRDWGWFRKLHSQIPLAPIANAPEATEFPFARRR
jgi:hypothetical protein